MNYSRFLDLNSLLTKKSIMLLGPRQTGKSTLVQKLFPNAYYVNLSESTTFREISSRPELIRERLSDRTKVLIIDEAQKIPELFDEVQVMLDRNKELRVILTGSSARKLRRKGFNLLPGRIWRRELFPLVYPEIKAHRFEERAIKGSLPGIIDSTDYKEELKNYVGLYLDEEVRAEGLVRGIGDFGRFLNIAALYNAELLNFTNVSNDTGVKLNTVRSYFQILEDTLIGHTLPAYKKTITRKPTTTPKFYFFDTGIVNSILNRFDVSAQSDIYGKAIEHLMFCELKAYLSYSAIDTEFTFWRSLSKIEVDFVLGDSIAIEVKAKERVVQKDEKGLFALSEDLKLKRKIIICRESQKRTTDSGVEIYPIQNFLAELWSGEIINESQLR